MLKRFRNDQQLAAIAGQFVPIKLDVGSDEYREWSRKHPSEGNTIAKLFVIRADGESLYARSGSLRGDDLPEMLVATLRQAGGILSPADAEKIDEVTLEFREKTEAGENAAAIKSLNRLKKMGVPGQLESYAAPVIELNQVVNGFIETKTLELADLQNAFEAETELSKLKALVKFYGLRRELNGLKQLKPTLSSLQKELSRNDAIRGLIRDAKAIEAVQSANSKSSTTRAIRKLRELLEETPHDATKTLGEQILKQATTGSNHPGSNLPHI